VEAQVKVQLRLWLIKVPCHEDVRGAKVRHRTVLISALNGGEQLASRPGRFNLYNHHTGGLVSITARLEGNETLSV
jgi:hypothetical protein